MRTTATDEDVMVSLPGDNLTSPRIPSKKMGWIMGTR